MQRAHMENLVLPCATHVLPDISMYLKSNDQTDQKKAEALLEGLMVIFPRFFPRLLIPGLRGTTRKDARLCVVAHGLRNWPNISVLICLAPNDPAYCEFPFSDLVQASVFK